MGFWFIVGLLFTSPFAQQWESVADKELIPYILEFDVEASVRGVKVFPSDYWHIALGERNYFKSEGAIGYCMNPAIWFGNTSSVTWPWHSSIVIKKSWWDKASEFKKRLTVVHELGHCSLHRNHEPIGFGSIMEPVISDSIGWIGWDLLMEELFDPSKMGNATYVDSNDVPKGY